MKYSFKCPLGGCMELIKVEAGNDEEALDKLVEKAREHLKSEHPDVTKTDAEIRSDVASQMTTVIEG